METNRTPTKQYDCPLIGYRGHFSGVMRFWRPGWNPRDGEEEEKEK